MTRRRAQVIRHVWRTDRAKQERIDRNAGRLTAVLCFVVGVMIAWRAL